MDQGARTVYARYPYTKGIELEYDLGAKPLLFLDIGLVYPGLIIWGDREGNAHPLHAGVAHFGERTFRKDEVVGRPWRAPLGLRYEAQPGEYGPTTPAVGSLIHEHGVYRLWHLDREPEGTKSLAGAETQSKQGYDPSHLGYVLRYTESDDGVTWRQPALDRLRVDGKPSSIVFGSLLSPQRGMGPCSVFVDHSAPPAERYKMLFPARMSADEHAALAARRGEPMDGLSAATGHQTIFGATSPDGIAWTALDEPVMLYMAEGACVGSYDHDRQSCVAHTRHWYTAQRRAIGISETRDFRHFPRPRPLLVQGLGDPLDTDWYTNAHTLYPGTTDVHLMFVGEYFRGRDDCVSLRVAASVNGHTYSLAPGSVAACSAGWSEEGVPDGDKGAAEPLVNPACVFPGDGMVKFGRDRVGILALQYNVSHKWPRTKQWSHWNGWLLWEKERLIALRCESEGGFTTAGLVLKSPTAYLNVRTEPEGFVRYGLLDSQGDPVPGFGVDTCDPIRGDHFRAALTWRGRTIPTEHAGKRIYLAFELSRARLFSLCGSERF
jgi:hypothetical protein